MKIKLKQFKYIKQEIDSKEVTLPTETVYYFQTGFRRAIRIQPVYTTWIEENELYGFDITFVYGSFEAKIEKISIRRSELEEIYYKDKGMDVEFVKNWLDGYLLERTEEQFNADFDNVFDKIK